MDGPIGSDRDSLAAWHSAYYAMVEQYRRGGRFMGKDQAVMGSACLQSPQLCLLVQADESHWFALHDWLRGEGASTNYSRLNTTEFTLL